MKKITFTLLVIIITISIESCQLKNSVTNPVTQVTVKNIRMVANMISSSFAPKAVITYSSNSGDNVQVQQLTLDLTESLPIGFKASLSGTCDGNYNLVGNQSSAAIDLKIYVNDTLKAEANDLKTDPSSLVTATASCSYLIK